MSLLRQLFMQKIGKDYPDDLEDVFFHLLRKEKHPPKYLLQDIKMLWFTPGDYKEGGGCILECLGGSYYCHTIEDYANNYRENFDCRRAISPLRSVKLLEDELEEYSHITKRDYSVIKEAINYYPENTGVDIVNIIRRLRNGELNFEILENDSSWSTGDLDLYDIDTTTLVIYREETTINDKWKKNIEKFLDEHMYPKIIPFNNEYGFIWLSSNEAEIYGRLILKQERGMNKNYWERTGPVCVFGDFYF